MAGHPGRLAMVPGLIRPHNRLSSRHSDSSEAMLSVPAQAKPARVAASTLRGVLWHMMHLKYARS